MISKKSALVAVALMAFPITADCGMDYADSIKLFDGCEYINPVQKNDYKPNTEEIEVEVSFYTTAADECGKSDGITTSGTKGVPGRTIAMSTDFDFGTKVVIEGHEYVVEDRGRAIKGNKVDILVDNKKEAFRRGRYTTTAQIIREEN